MKLVIIILVLMDVTVFLVMCNVEERMKVRLLKALGVVICGSVGTAISYVYNAILVASRL